MNLDHANTAEDSVRQVTSSISNTGQYLKRKADNSWIQFCRIKKTKTALEKGEDDASFNFKVALEEWRNMTKEEKSFYGGLAKAEHNSAEKRNPVVKKKRIRKLKTAVKGKADIGEKTGDEKKNDFDHAALEFLDKLEKIDSELEIEEDLINTASKRLEEGKIKVAIFQCKLENKKEELCRFKDKLALLTKQHASCQLND